MGTIVRLLEKHLKPQSSIVGCFHNLYKSVSTMNDDNFVIQACKNTDLCCRKYRDIGTTKCSCGRTMKTNIYFEGEKVDGCSGNEADVVFITCRTSFIITDDLKVVLNSMGLVLEALNDLGYEGFDKLREWILMLVLMRVSIHFGSSLNRYSLEETLCDKKTQNFDSMVQESRVVAEGDALLTLKVFVRKLNKTILYAECREEFIDFLFTILAIPHEFAWELCVDNDNMGCVGNFCMGCVGNFCRSVKGLSFEKKKNKDATTSKCILPHYYNCSAQLLDLDVSDSPITGIVKGETNFIMSDDLVVTPMNSSLTISLLSTLQMNINSIEEKVISIGKAEATSLLRAALITTSALTNVLSSFLLKMDTTEPTSKIQKSDTKTL